MASRTTFCPLSIDAGGAGLPAIIPAQPPPPTVPIYGRRPIAGNVDTLMSKRTKKATLRARKKKANHGRKPNRGRNS